MGRNAYQKAKHKAKERARKRRRWLDRLQRGDKLRAWFPPSSAPAQAQLDLEIEQAQRELQQEIADDDPTRD